MVYQQFVCKQSNSDCKSLDPDKTFSPMSFAALGTTTNYKRENGTGVIPYSNGGSTIHALASLNTDGGFADACYPYDQFVSKFKKNAAELRDAFEKLRRDYYDRNKATEGSICMNCLLKDLEKNFNIKRDNKEVLAALGEDIFDKFLYDIFVGSCKKFMDPVPFSVKTWPERSDFSYNDMIQKMKGLFKDNTPVVIGACLDDKVPAEQCKTRHEFVVAGYRKYCKPDGTCRETLRIPNSWGQDWLDANNDGWVDAKNLYEYIYKQKGVMGWLTPQG